MKISIITVCFNSEEYIASAIESVLEQDYTDIEYIVVDGNSSDRTLDIIKSFECSFEGRLKWISEPDNGLYDAMNKGIKMATGDVVGILNSDDFYNHADCITLIVNALLDEHIDSCFADVRFVKPSDLNKTVRYYSSGKFNPSKFRYGYMPAHPSFFVRKRCFEQYGYYKTDYQIAADYELLVRFLQANKITYKYLPLDIIKMRTGGKSTKNWKSNYVLNKEIVRGCRENGISTSMCLLFFKYFVKVFEFIKTRD